MANYTTSQGWTQRAGAGSASAITPSFYELEMFRSRFGRLVSRHIYISFYITRRKWLKIEFWGELTVAQGLSGNKEKCRSANFFYHIWSKCIRRVNNWWRFQSGRQSDDKTARCRHERNAGDLVSIAVCNFSYLFLVFSIKYFDFSCKIHWVKLLPEYITVEHFRLQTWNGKYLSVRRLQCLCVVSDINCRQKTFSTIK